MPPLPGRPASRRSGIVEDLRARIIGGEWAPGTKLPPLRALAARHAASFLTVQQAAARLAQEGFVEARQGRGVYVARRLPHRDHYLILGAVVEEDERENKFLAAVDRAAVELEREEGWRLTIWHPDEAAPGETFARVEEHLRARRFAGMMLQGLGRHGTGLLDRCAPMAARHGVPLAAFALPRVDAGPPPEGVGYVWLDFRDFFRKALDRLRDEGCRRVGALVLGGTIPSAAWSPDDLRAEAARRGLRMEPHWIQYSAVWGPDYPRNLMRLWMSVPRAQRPEGLVVADDNLVEDATRGIAEAEVRVPRDLRIVAHVNFQSPARSVVPVTWLGFDEKELIARAVAYLQAAARGENPPRHHAVPARFEEPAPAFPPLPGERSAAPSRAAIPAAASPAPPAAGR